MTATEMDARRLYTERADTYLRFVRSVAYPLGLKAYFSRSAVLRSDLRTLDAGCGTGVVSLALREALVGRGLRPGSIAGFDLTPAMLDRFRETLEARGISGIQLTEANVLELDTLPASWTGYDLIVSASMLEYIPRESLPKAFDALRARLNDKGVMVLFITRQNWLMKPLIQRWWQGNLYARTELRTALEQAGFSSISFARFPFPFTHLNLWGHIIEAHL